MAAEIVFTGLCHSDPHSPPTLSAPPSYLNSQFSFYWINGKLAGCIGLRIYTSGLGKQQNVKLLLDTDSCLDETQLQMLLTHTGQQTINSMYIISVIFSYHTL